MKQINFKIEKTAAEVKTYVEINSIYEMLKEEMDNYDKKASNCMDKVAEMAEAEILGEIIDQEEGTKIAEKALKFQLQAYTLEIINNKLVKQQIEFIEKTHENGFD